MLTFAICYDFAFLFQENKSRLVSAKATKFGDYCLIADLLHIILTFKIQNGK